MTEVEEYINKWNLGDISVFTKSQFKKMLRGKIYELNRNQILDWSKKYKKLDYNKICIEKFELKSYFKEMDIQQSRLNFKIRCYMTPTIRLNFKSDPKFKSEKWVCTDCVTEDVGSCDGILQTGSDQVIVEMSSKKLRGFPDSQEHQMFHCQGNADLREGKDIAGNEKDCVLFFQQLIQRRLDKLS